MSRAALTSAYIGSIETWVDELEQARRTGQYEHAVAHTVASMQTAVACLRHLAAQEPGRHDD